MYYFVHFCTILYIYIHGTAVLIIATLLRFKGHRDGCPLSVMST